MVCRERMMRCRLLVIVVCVGAGAVAHAQNKPKQDRTLRQEMMARYELHDWKGAIEIGHKLAKFSPTDGGVAYDLSCLYALSGDKKSAVAWLDKSVDRGYLNHQHMRLDSDLATIRQESGFKAAVKKAEEKAEALFEAALNVPPVVVVPPKLDSAVGHPLIIALHGFGGRPQGIASVWTDAAAKAGAIVAAPRGILPVGERGFSWGSVDQTNRVVFETIKRVAARHKVDASKVILTGFSQGGFMSFNLGLGHPGKFRGVIPVAGRYDPEMAPLPRHAAMTTPAFYLMVGSEDRALSSNRQAASVLRSNGFRTEMVVFPGVGHAFPDDASKELSKALAFVLKED
jgi:phospholipase/carboxylesterase